nr:venom polypeptide precursor [Doratifera vulnerans]
MFKMGYKLMNFVMLLFVCSINRQLAEFSRNLNRIKSNPTTYRSIW